MSQLPPSGADIVLKMTQLRDRLNGARSSWHPLWNDCATFCCPDRRQIITSAGNINESYRPLAVENSEAKDSLATMAGGLKQWICEGPGSGWIQLQPSEAGGKQSGWGGFGDSKDDVRRWLIECTKILDLYLEQGGYYDAVHEVFQDLGVFGTAGLLLMPGIEKPFVCQSLAPTEFVFQKSWDGHITDGILTWHKTAGELKQMFSRPTDTLSPQVTASISGNRPDEKTEIILAYSKREKPRAPQYPGDPLAMPYAGYWIDVQNKVLMREEGFEDMPLAVPRWNKWSNSPLYGVSPAMLAIADIKEVNVADMISSVVLKTQVEPRLKRKAGEMGAIDLRPGGITEVAEMDAVQTWGTGENLSQHDKRIDRKLMSIRRAFYAQLFDPLAGVDREITAQEARMREDHSLSRIAPPASRIATDLVMPTIRRAFMMLYRLNLFPPAPAAAYSTDALGRRLFLYPRVVQANRLARALSRKVGMFRAWMDRTLPLAQLKPDLLDAYNIDNMLKDIDLSDGMPKEWRLTADEMAQLRQARAQQEQAMMAQQIVGQAIASKPGEVAAIAQQMGDSQ